MKRRVIRVGVIWLLLFCAVAAVFLVRPACPFFKLTGWQCAGCGATRMAELLLQGKVREAFGQNSYVLLAAPLLVCYGAGESVRYVQGKPALLATRAAKIFLTVLLGAGIFFFVARNIR